MSAPRQMDEEARLTREAADWFARQRAEDVNEIDSARFRAWLGRETARRDEFDEIDSLWQEMDALADAPEIREEREALRKALERSGRRGGVPNSRSRGALAKLTAIAAVLGFVVVGAYLAPGGLRSPRYTTDVGEQRLVALPDGSSITLNTSTVVKVRYSETARDIELVSGQANFEVARDPHRPFIVTAGSGTVRALGTIFDVYRSTDRVTVTLIEGKVAVTPHEESRAPETVNLSVGQQVSYPLGAGAVRKAMADLPRVNAWRSRKLQFDDTPLSEAIAESNRYSISKIELDAPGLASARISGTFDAGKNSALANALQSYFDLRVSRLEDGTLLLSQR